MNFNAVSNFVSPVLVGGGHVINGSAAVLKSSNGLYRVLKLSEGINTWARVWNKDTLPYLAALSERINSINGTIYAFNIIGSLEQFTKIKEGKLVIWTQSTEKIGRNVSLLFASICDTSLFLHKVGIINIPKVGAAIVGNVTSAFDYLGVAASAVGNLKVFKAVGDLVSPLLTPVTSYLGGISVVKAISGSTIAKKLAQIDAIKYGAPTLYLTPIKNAFVVSASVFSIADSLKALDKPLPAVQVSKDPDADVKHNDYQMRAHNNNRGLAWITICTEAAKITLIAVSTLLGLPGIMTLSFAALAIFNGVLGILKILVREYKPATDAMINVMAKLYPV